MGTSPDLFFRSDRIGFYGNKEWFLWLLDKATTDKKIRVCGCTETALALMSNQHVDSWKEWVTTNRNRTQEEWIRDGFSKHGVSAHLPPDASDVEPLLKLIGQKSWNFLSGGPQGTNAPEAIPNYVQYNAFRWLRDSGFNPTGFAVSNAALVAPQDMTIALIKYSRWHGEFSGRDELGILAFGKRADSDVGFGPPLIMKPWFLTAVYSSITVLSFGGLWLVTFRRRKSPPTPDAQ